MITTQLKARFLQILPGLVLSCAALFTSAATQAAPAIFNTATCAPDGIALGGYDAVSYHTEGGPLPGKAEHAVTLGELTYTFATVENLNTFQADPERFTPTYLGWCSATLSMGRLACPDYANFQIEDGRLLLFERVGFTNGRDMWNVDPLRSKHLADGHFAELSRQ